MIEISFELKFVLLDAKGEVMLEHNGYEYIPGIVIAKTPESFDLNKKVVTKSYRNSWQIIHKTTGTQIVDDISTRKKAAKLVDMCLTSESYEETYNLLEHKGKLKDFQNLRRESYKDK